VSKKQKPAGYPGHGKSKIMKKLAKVKAKDVAIPTPTSWYGIPYGIGKSAIITLDDAHREAKEQYDRAYTDMEMASNALLIDYLWTELDKARAEIREAAKPGDIVWAYPSREAVIAERRQGYPAPLPMPYIKKEQN